MVDRPTADITTLDNEIMRHRALADIFNELARLSKDEKIFSPSSIAETHNQSANRLMYLKSKLKDGIS